MRRRAPADPRVRTPALRAGNARQGSGARAAPVARLAPAALRRRAPPAAPGARGAAAPRPLDPVAVRARAARPALTRSDMESARHVFRVSLLLLVVVVAV